MLRSAKERTGASRRKACAQLGVAAQTLRNWEHGRTEPSDAMLEDLARLNTGTFRDYEYRNTRSTRTTLQKLAELYDKPPLWTEPSGPGNQGHPVAGN